MSEVPREAASLVYSTDALRHRAKKAGLSSEETEAIIDGNVSSLAQLAFAISPPGTSPSDDAVRDFYNIRVPVNVATITSTKLLVFEAHTLVVANIKSEISKKDEPSHHVLPPAERDRRIQEQQTRLSGLRFKGDEENAHSNYDLAFSMLERDTLLYIHPEKFVTRRYELQQKKPSKEIVLDHSALTVRDKQTDFTCPTRTELELFQAMRRRALAFDLVGLCKFEVMNAYQSELLQHLQEEPPPGYHATTLVQILRADRAAFLQIAEHITSLKRDSGGDMPLEKHLPLILSKPGVSFHLLPLASVPSRPAQPKAAPSNKRKAEHEETRPTKVTKGPNKGKGKGKGKRKGRGPNVPKELIGKALQTASGERICWPARFIKRRFRYNPPVLRTDQFPDGLPNLRPDLQARVSSANALYNVTQQLCRLCISVGVFFSIENPEKSFFWQTHHMRLFLQDAEYFEARFHHCLFGSSRRKFTLLVHNVPTLKELECRCDNTHPHEPWGHTPQGWATAQETAYPWPLCRAIAAKIALYVQQLGAICHTPSFAVHTMQLEQIRRDTQVQTNKRVLPLVSEFLRVQPWPAHQPLPANARLLSTPSVGNIASGEQVTIGIHRSPDEFVKDALVAKHPGTGSDSLPPAMAQAISFCAGRPPLEVARHRSEFLRKAIHKAAELQPQEEELKSSLSERRRSVLSSKRLLLFKWLMEDTEASDTNLFSDLCNGFDLTGALPESNSFAKRFKPAQLPTDALRGIAKKSREALLVSIKSSGDPMLDNGVYEATMKEVDRGFVVGPIDPDSLPHGATLTRRFGVVQKDKVRPIDDYRASLVNSSVTQAETVSIHGIDHIAGMGAEMLRTSLEWNSQPELVAKCWDLASAYKQVPLSDQAYAMDSYLAVFNPKTQKAEVYQQRVLPFGSIASVTAFLRCSLAIWHIGCMKLKLLWSAYFDDFLNICDKPSAAHTDMCVSLFFQLLGWKLSEDKLVPYDVCCKVLGDLPWPIPNKFFPIKAYDAFPMSSEDGGGLFSVPDWSQNNRQALDSLYQLRIKWRQMILDQRLDRQLLAYVARGPSVDPPFSDEVLQPFMKELHDFITAHGLTPDWSVREHQPMRLHILAALSTIMADKDTTLFDSLIAGVSTGFAHDIPPS
eukprot:s176_g4.t1